jgi:hypothetical protein
VDVRRRSLEDPSTVQCTSYAAPQCTTMPSRNALQPAPLFFMESERHGCSVNERAESGYLPPSLPMFAGSHGWARPGVKTLFSVLKGNSLELCRLRLPLMGTRHPVSKVLHHGNVHFWQWTSLLSQAFENLKSLPFKGQRACASAQRW